MREEKIKVEVSYLKAIYLLMNSLQFYGVKFVDFPLCFCFLCHVLLWGMCPVVFFPYGLAVVPVVAPEWLIFQEEVRIQIFKDAVTV